MLALLAEVAAFGVGWSLTMVEVDDERLKVLARGARCVSLSSVMGLAALAMGAKGKPTLGELPRHGCELGVVGRSTQAKRLW